MAVATKTFYRLPKKTSKNLAGFIFSQVLLVAVIALEIFCIFFVNYIFLLNKIKF
jgi:hypothetical protein